MRVGIEDLSKNIEKVFEIIREYVGKTVEIEELLKKMFEGEVVSSDLLFIILQEMEGEYARGLKEKVEILKELEAEKRKAIKDEILRRVNKKIFFTPLEVAKFYQCPRRLWLEKIVLSQQVKEERGRVWNGEALHLAVKLLIEKKGNPGVEEIVKNTFESYGEKVSILKRERLKAFLEKLQKFLKEEGLEKLYPEKTFLSLKHNLVGTPDLVGTKNGEMFTIDVKFGKLEKQIKKEHLLQAVGEVFLANNYFRKKPKHSYILYFESESLVRIDVDEKLINLFLGYLKKINSCFSSPFIPPKSKLKNYKKRVCQGCHVKLACQQIESFRRKERKPFTTKVINIQ